MDNWEIVALPQGDEIMKNGKVASTDEAERILNYHHRLREALSETQKLLDNMQEHACACNFYISEDHKCGVCISADKNRTILTELDILENEL